MSTVVGAELSCADYFALVLREMPSKFGQLIYLASLWSPEPPGYQDSLVRDQFEAAEVHRALQRLHFQSFLKWLCFSLEQQSEDLRRWLAEPETPAMLHWLALHESHRRRLIPIQATPPEEVLFLSDLAALLKVARPPW